MIPVPAVVGKSISTVTEETEETKKALAGFFASMLLFIVEFLPEFLDGATLAVL